MPPEHLPRGQPDQQSGRVRGQSKLCILSYPPFFSFCLILTGEPAYQALIGGLAHAHREGIRRLDVQGDSELVVRQMNGLYQVKDERLKELHARATRARQEFDHVELEHIFREENTEADALANQAMDTRTTSPGLSVLQEKGGDLA